MTSLTEHLLGIQPVSPEHESRIAGKLADIRRRIEGLGDGGFDMEKYHQELHMRELLFRAMERIDALEVRLRALEGRQGSRVATPMEQADSSFSKVLEDV